MSGDEPDWPPGRLKNGRGMGFFLVPPSATIQHAARGVILEYVVVVVLEWIVVVVHYVSVVCLDVRSSASESLAVA